ncbi:ABC transporter substrate-binding protein [Mesorhizobium sp. Root157]|uniref:ABC transporter substrate-binding protein n=1 Tax=Mesorhizobium sp. Root157 TaxID=1736477 RepID=UPI001FCD70C2|nr:ABC transporter substrate-binding protein [Mesorhizobium sp. Root157]
MQPEFVEVSPIIAAFRRMVRGLEFDICELAPTTYLIAREHGVPITALPIFMSRRFHHSGLQVRNDAGIEGPKDLEGKKVGVRAYSVTTGVWTRGILANEFGVDNSRIEWVVDDEEHVQSLQLPPTVTHAPQGRSISELMAEGEIQAGFASRAGIGRKGAPGVGWEAPETEAQPYRELFADAPRLEAEWYRRTGIYPVHGCLVVRDDVLAADPSLARRLYEAFEAAKQAWLPAFWDGGDDVLDKKKYAKIATFVGADPLPNGIEKNRATINTLVGYAHQQGLISRRPAPEEIFLDPTA